MAIQWFCAVKGQQLGPYDDGRLRSMIQAGQIAAEDLVWREGMTAWLPASQVPDLAPLAAPAVPSSAGAPLAMALPAAGMLSYATPAVGAAAMAPAQFFVAEPDPGPFSKMGGSFTVNGSRWSGPAFASPRAFYLLKRAKNMQGYGGGLVGMALSAALAKHDDLRTCDLNQLPDTVQAVLDPKRKRKQKPTDVIVLPRDATRQIKIPRINNVVTVFAGSDKFGIVTNLFSHGRIRRFLTENGWTINAELAPLAAPVHGVGYGRAEGERGGPSLFKRIAYITLAVVLFALVVASRVGCDAR